MRAVFLGSPPFATPILRRLLGSHHRPVLCVTPPARPRGRGRRVVPSAVAELAAGAGVPLLQPSSVRDEAFLEQLAAVEADVFLVVSYGELLRQSFLDLPRVVTLNVHPSLLPRHRGATPVPATILAGDRTTGVSIQRVVLELDAGDVLLASRTEVRAGETAGELSERLAVDAGELLIQALDAIDSGEARYTPQDPGGVTHCRRLSKEEGAIDWRRSAVELERHVRAMNPWPLAHTVRPDGSRMVIHRAHVVVEDDAIETQGRPGTVRCHGTSLWVACGEGALEPTLLQAPGKRPMETADFLRGARLADDERWGQEQA